MTGTREEQWLRGELDRLAERVPLPRQNDVAAANAAWTAVRGGGRRGWWRPALRRPALLVPVFLAVVVLIASLAVVLPGLVNPVQPAGPHGLPQRWTTPAPSTPLVTDAPIEAASMVLWAPDAYEGGGLGADTAPGPVLVSADGREYRRIPWDAGDRAPRWGEGNVALSPDGTWVAWSTPTMGAGDTITLLRLKDGAERSAQLDPSMPIPEVAQLLWSRDGRYVYVVVPQVNGYRIHTVGVEPPVQAPTSELVADVTSLPDGRLASAPVLNTDLGRRVIEPPAGTVVDAPEADAVSVTSAGSQLLALPGGRDWVEVLDDGGPRVQVSRDGAGRRDAPERFELGGPAPDAVLPLAATPSRVLLSLSYRSAGGDPLRPSGSELRWMDLDTGSTTVVGTGTPGGRPGAAVPIAVASGLVR